ncbi:MAG: SDR family oxidoreductase [Caulobacteraceae bacterium]|nr:SDR family oxidoreductase [Caulobacteraceae bacterium]
MTRRLALITGASAGIGQAFARVYAAHGWDVALTGRRAERLHQLADDLRMQHGIETLVAPADLTDPAAPERLLEAIRGQGRVVDALVNNAGYSNTHGFAASAFADHRAFLQVLLEAPVELAHRVLPDMLERRFGRIINVASVAGLLPATGGDTLYGPTKSFLIKFSQGLHLEVRDRGVHVSALCPGYTFSEFHDVNGSRAAMNQAVPHWLWMQAEDVAVAGYEAVEANRPVCVPGAPYKTIAALLKALPDDWTLALTARHGSRLGRL